MAKKSFFSWQSDNKPVRNKFQKALKAAVEQLGHEVDEAERPELDSDTKGTFGSEEIVNTIFEKIDSSVLFIADVTPIAQTSKKLLPNPNVMVEVGYALKSMSRHSRLYIFCSTDEIEVDPEKMPFDLKGKSLFGFAAHETPSQIAKQLKPMLEGMLKQQEQRPTEEDEYPYIYVRGATFSSWAEDAKTANFSIYNADSKEYLLEAIDIEGKSAEPFRGLSPGKETVVVLNGVSQIFESSTPLINMTVTRAGRKYRLQQKIDAPKGADEQFHFGRFIESSTLIRD